MLFDTSFLLPIVGFETSRRIMDVFPGLKRYQLYYSELSILELLWKIAKKLAVLKDDSRDRAMARVRLGINVIVSSMNRVDLTLGSVSLALEMYAFGA